MKQILQLNYILIGIAVFTLLIVNAGYPETEAVRARIGIQLRSGNRVEQARYREEIRTGDFLRIYVQPEKTSYVYVVHTDNKTATLLNYDKQKNNGSAMVMPSLDEYYQVDGLSKKESFTIICSPTELPHLLKSFSAGVAPHSDWVGNEARFVDNSQMDLDDIFDTPFAIEGNAQNISGANKKDPFVDLLKIFSGKSLLIKKYEFYLIR